MRNVLFRFTQIIGTFFLLMCSSSVNAQSSQILSVTPPLFQITALPGDVWQSTIKVVNGNPFPMTVYAEVVNFSPTGENGQGEFFSVKKDEAQIIDTSDTDGATLAEWVEIPPGPHQIQPEQTQEISFIVDIPKNASPGGHYAAVLISTEPPNNIANGPLVRTSQAVTSLFFLRVEGDVIEQGSIREFRLSDSILEKPQAEFSLRFENKGNVHLLPRGEIRITNMWGTERGVIPVNYQTQFGNVLPKSIREYHYTWSSDFNLSDIGRYKAIVTLGYGTDGVKSESATVYFWVIPLKATLIVVSILTLIISSLVWMVRAYVRRMLILAGVDPKEGHVHLHTTPRSMLWERGQPNTRSVPQTHITAPLRYGVLDLRARMHATRETMDVMETIIGFVRVYKKFFISLLIIIIIFIITVMYIAKATEEHNRYQITVDEGMEYVEGVNSAQ